MVEVTGLIEKHAKNIVSVLFLVNGLAFLFVSLLLAFTVAFIIFEVELMGSILLASFFIIPFLLGLADLISIIWFRDDRKNARIIASATGLISMVVVPALLIQIYLLSTFNSFFIVVGALNFASYAIVLFLFYGKKTKKLFD